MRLVCSAMLASTLTAYNLRVGLPIHGRTHADNRFSSPAHQHGACRVSIADAVFAIVCLAVVKI